MIRRMELLPAKSFPVAFKLLEGRKISLAFLSPPDEPQILFASSSA
jgi:hypothetical protein